MFKQLLTPTGIGRAVVVATLAYGASAVLPHGEASAGIIYQSLGTSAPPATLGGFPMTPFSDDTRPLNQDVTTVPFQLGQLTFSGPALHLEVGSGWATWSNSYAGDVYFRNEGNAASGPITLTISLPNDPAVRSAFYFYAEPAPFSVVPITSVAISAITASGTSVTENVLGFAGAHGFGFYTTDDDQIETITISSPEAFAVGQFGYDPDHVNGGTLPPQQEPNNTVQVPEPATLALFGFGLAGLGLVSRRRKIA